MWIIIGIYFLIIAELVLQIAVVTLAIYFPYISGFLGTSLLYYIWVKQYPWVKIPYTDIIPGHPGLSYIVFIVIAEVIMFIMLNNRYTKKAMIVLLCVTVPAYFLTETQVTVASWQMALLLTVVGMVLFGIEGFIAVQNHTPEDTVDDNLFVAIFDCISYSGAIAMFLYSITHCFWEPYMENIGKLNTFIIVRIIIGIILIAGVIILKVGPFVLEKIRNRY